MRALRWVIHSPPYELKIGKTLTNPLPFRNNWGGVQWLHPVILAKRNENLNRRHFKTDPNRYSLFNTTSLNLADTPIGYGQLNDTVNVQDF